MPVLCKSYKISAKKVQKSYLSWQWKVMQSLKENWVEVSNLHEEFGKFSPNHSQALFALSI